MNEKFIESNNERTFYDKSKDLSDRELQEFIAFKAKESVSLQKSISNNVQFIFYVTLAYVIATAMFAFGAFKL